MNNFLFSTKGDNNDAAAAAKLMVYVKIQRQIEKSLPLFFFSQNISVIE
jgi:hypothetical protein